MLPTLLRFTDRVGRRTRLALVAAFLLLAAVSSIEAAHTKPSSGRGATVGVVVAVRALPAGRVLTRQDVATARWPAQLRPATSTPDAHPLLGRRLAGPISAGEAITFGRLLGNELTTGLGTDVVAVPIAIAAEVGRLIHAGDRVDLIAVPRPDIQIPDGSAPRVGAAQLVVGRSRVLAVFEPSGGTAGSAGGGDGTQVVLAVPRSFAVRIATLDSSHVFTVVADDP